MVSTNQQSEVELKLALGPDDLRWLEAHPLLAGRSKPRALLSTYFDTLDHQLRKAGWSLRVRSEGPRRRQAIKAVDGASAGLFARGEWERDVHANHPDRDTLKDTPLDTLLSDEAIKALRPLFTVKVSRTVHLVEHDGAEIEVALDKGRIDADGRSQPLCELELELKRGPSSALFALAQRLFEPPPLRLSPRSKADAGFALLRPRKAAVKADDVALTPGMTTAEAFQAIGRACLSHYCLNEPLVRLERSPGALHQARIALRRLRAAMSLFGPLVADEQSGVLKAEMRRTAGVLGEARDLDVFKERLEADGGRPDLLAALEVRRIAAYDRVVRTLETAPSARLAFDIAAWLEAGDWLASDELRPLLTAPATAVAAEVLARRRAKVRKQGPHLHKLSPEKRHRVRIEVKKLRYAAEFFTGLAEGDKARKRADNFAAALRPLQEALGDLNDLATQEVMAEPIDVDLAHAAAARRRREEPEALARAEKAAVDFAEAKSFLSRRSSPNLSPSRS